METELTSLSEIDVMDYSGVSIIYVDRHFCGKIWISMGQSDTSVVLNDEYEWYGNAKSWIERYCVDNQLTILEERFE